MIGYIDSNGKYKHGKPEKPMTHDVSSQFKDWSHDNQRKRMNGDIIQPYIDGQPNREFIEVYRGEVADKYFNREQQDKADRELS